MQLVFAKTDDQQTIELIGQVDGIASLTPEHREHLKALLVPGCNVVVDATRVTHMTAAGMRLLLLIYRVARTHGSIRFTGASSELIDLAEITGFRPRNPGKVDLVQTPETFRILPRVVDYPTHEIAGFSLRRGTPYPLGATVVEGGVNFAVFSKHATSCTLVLFKRGATQPMAEIRFPDEFVVGHVYTMVVFGLPVEHFEYGYRMSGPHDVLAGHRFDDSTILLDPYAPCISGRDVWRFPILHGGDLYPYRGCLVPEDFDWEQDRPPARAFEDLIICEIHTRGFTASSTSGVKFPGTYAGLVEKIGYLKELGVNCVELMPVFEFDECVNKHTHPETGERLLNYWGYNTIGFWTPKAGFAASGRAGMQVDEFKTMVRELHRHGIEVILDVVFNHTAESDDTGPTISFRGLDNKTYYLLKDDGNYYDYSGCGNTLNCNHPIVRDFVKSCLRYWVSEYHIDGFRFDLASILGRDQRGVPLSNPPLLEALAHDPVLGKTKLIAEAWDAGGLYQVGSFPAYGRWAEWNGRYRDCARRFLRGEAGHAREMAERLFGSSDLYHGRGTAASINFITCHDGFTLADLVSYDHKHNHANGEDGRDGSSDNLSWNCGVEGPTDDEQILDLRLRQMKNATAILFLSQGVPMFPMGDECARTQQGNNNTYCHDGPINWFDWTLPDKNADLHRFTKRLIAFRQKHPALRHPLHASEKDENGDGLEVVWHGTRPTTPDWSDSSRVLAYALRDPINDPGTTIYVVMNMWWEGLRFLLPAPPDGCQWYTFCNTATPTPDDVILSLYKPLRHRRLLVTGRSIVVLVATRPLATISPGVNL